MYRPVVGVSWKGVVPAIPTVDARMAVVAHEDDNTVHTGSWGVDTEWARTPVVVANEDDGDAAVADTDDT